MGGRRSRIEFTAAGVFCLTSAAAIFCPAPVAAAEPVAAPAPAPPQSISVKAARELAGRGGPIVLDDLDSLVPEAALNLACSAGGISLDGLATLDPATARALALHGQLPAELPEGLDLGSLLERVGTIAGGEDDGPDFAGLERLLAELNGGKPAGAAPGDPWLSLGGLRVLELDVARALALHEGPLLLDGLASLSAEAAAALASHSGELSLTGLESLPADVRKLLAAHTGPVVIPDALLDRPSPGRPAPKPAP